MNVAMKDIKRFNGYIKKKLPVQIQTDFLAFRIFNERDLHSAAYHYIRDFFRKKERERIVVRCEPRLLGKKPDIVVYNNTRPYYVIEFKTFLKPDQVNRVNANAVYEDIQKLEDFLQKTPSSWAFLILVYDSPDDNVSRGLADQKLKQKGFEKISVVAINVSRHKSGYRRAGYSKWRRQFDHLWEKHKEYGHSSQSKKGKRIASSRLSRKLSPSGGEKGDEELELDEFD